jgi:hypothetical protein
LDTAHDLAAHLALFFSRNQKRFSGENRPQISETFVRKKKYTITEKWEKPSTMCDKKYIF